MNNNQTTKVNLNMEQEIFSISKSPNFLINDSVDIHHSNPNL